MKFEFHVAYQLSENELIARHEYHMLIHMFWSGFGGFYGTHKHTTGHIAPQYSKTNGQMDRQNKFIDKSVTLVINIATYNITSSDYMSTSYNIRGPTFLLKNVPTPNPRNNSLLLPSHHMKGNSLSIWET